MTELLLSLLLYFTTPTEAQPIQKQSPVDVPTTQTTEKKPPKIGGGSWG
ncbi:MAG: hypothetical protein AAF734_02130 [Bacteroidota bacterium]